MGEVKAEMRKLETENKRLRKEVERLERRRIAGATSTRNKQGSPRGSGGANNGNSSDSHSLNVEATFYTAYCSTGCVGITATGLDVRNTIYAPNGLRIIAVDPTVIKLGSRVRVTLENGDNFKAVAGDTGGDIKGARIDVLVSDKATARKLGRQAATVEIINE